MASTLGRSPSAGAGIGRGPDGYLAGGGMRPVTPPDFDVDLGEEIEAAMAEHLAAVDVIATGPWPPSFEDTVAALERAGRRVHRAEQLLDDAAVARSTAAIQA